MTSYATRHGNSEPVNLKPIWAEISTKKRIPLTRGKSCGVRAVMAFKSEHDLFFVNGWVKNVVKKGCKEIPDDVLLLYKAVAIQMMSMTPEQAQIALKAGKMREVKCDG